MDVAQRLGKDPETVRRWIRAGKVPATKVGLQYLVDERDLPSSGRDSFPTDWGRTVTGEPMPDVVALLRRARTGH